MADIAVDLGASDILSLGGSFIAQNTTASVSQEHAEMLKANGDFQKLSSVFNIETAINAVYKFSEDTGLGAALPSVGSVSGSYLITSCRIDTVNNDYPTITLTAHNHSENLHTTGNEYAVPADMQAIATGAYGAYDWAGLGGAAIACIRSSYELRCDHIEQNGETGNHWVGTSVKGMEELSCEYSGNIANPPTISGWTVETSELADSNEEHDTSSVSAVRIVARTE